ncbi:MAG: type IV toxin-antitoxin system AbiEi family antitoxin [Bacteroidales bacterium]|nr:type IV toxin-antitoxin system AbiEi family antitoxin [Bacteroidales bacterium]
MNLDSGSKLNRLLAAWLPGKLFFSAWLRKNGYSDQLIQQYRKSGWFTSLSKGVFMRKNDRPNIFGSLTSFNEQLNKNYYIGAHSALELAGFSHFIPFGENPVLMIGHSVNEKIPGWLTKIDFGFQLHFFSSTYFPNPVLTTIAQDNYFVKISSPEQAFMECLLLAPQHYDLMGLYLIMEQLATVRPEIIQSILEQTNNIKVKRLFLFMAQKAGHDWFFRLDRHRINLGKGKQQLVKNGVYLSDFLITIPTELRDYV